MNRKFDAALYIKDAKTLPLWVENKVHTPENLPPVHSHDFAELVYVVYGRAQHLFEGNYYDIMAGDVIMIKPGDNHTYIMNSNDYFEIINCLFIPAFLQERWIAELGMTQELGGFMEHPFFKRDEEFHHRLRLSREDAECVHGLLNGMLKELDQSRHHCSKTLKLQMIQLLLTLLRFYEEWRLESNNASPVLKNKQIIVTRIIEYLNQHYEQKISIPDICRFFNISFRHLHRIFKNETGMTITEMAHHTRIEKAKQMLVNSNESVVTIACCLGYSDSSFFSQLFKRKVGCSPGTYRRQFK